MGESSFSRCRNAALLGLFLQGLAMGAAMLLGSMAASHALLNIGWYLLGGLPIWVAALLVFRQHELAELEKMDLEALRREKQAAGGVGLFDEEGAAGLGFMVASARLAWMQKWLVPALSLVTGAYLAVMAWLNWQALPNLYTDRVEAWPPLRNVPLAMIGAAVVMLLLFLFSRYASGMGRIPRWQLLRACGSYMLGNAVALLALILVLGLQLYAGLDRWHRFVAYAIPIVMMLLAVETFVNLVLDIYRPRIPGTEPRAAFDSRILGLLSEPGGLAHSIAEALNYQFGFPVSQTWFYQLLARTVIPLFALGALALWALTCIVIVQPNERAIIEWLGAQRNADNPLKPGLHFKWPWPLAVARKYDTGQLHQIIIGYSSDATPTETKSEGEPSVILWTDEKHFGRTHYNFLIAPRADLAAPSSSASPLMPSEARVSEAAPVHMVRMNVAVQYRIQDEALAAFTQRTAEPDRLLRDLAWEEVLRYCAGAHIDALLGESRVAAGRELRERLSRRVTELGLGLEVVYVGLQEVHPQKDVAEAFRNVVRADQERITQIRKARVAENQKLSQAAGDTRKALRLFRATQRAGDYESEVGRQEPAAAAARAQVPAELWAKVQQLAAPCKARAAAEAAHDEALAELELVREDVELGLGRSARDRETAEALVKESARQLEAAEGALRAAIEPLRTELAALVGADPAAALLAHYTAQQALSAWTARLDAELIGDPAASIRPVDGDAAQRLAGAQAARWQAELRAVAEAATIGSEYQAYAAAPEVYQARRYLEALTQGLKGARKFFLAFEPGDRKVNVWIEAQDAGEDTPLEGPTRRPTTP